MLTTPTNKKVEVMTTEKKKPEAQDDWKQRVIDEAAELTEKLENLKAFLGSKKIKEMPDSETQILKTQALYMGSYLTVLNTRISRF